MSDLFSSDAGRKVLKDLRAAFENKRIYYRKGKFIMFVCGGELVQPATSLRKHFVDWAAANLPDFICLLAEDALKDSFAGEGRRFVNLGKFETILADVADCVIIFPESPGSFAETGFFANSPVIRGKSLVVNRFSLQSAESFLNLGPIDTISAKSFLKPTVLVNAPDTLDFTPIKNRLQERIKPPQHRERLPYQPFKKFNFRQKLLIIFEILRLLRLADLKTLRYVVQACFDGSPQQQELAHLLKILLAAKFIQRAGDTAYFTTIPGIKLVEIEHLEVERLSAQIQYFYQKYSRELYDALPAISQ